MPKGKIIQDDDDSSINKVKWTNKSRQGGRQHTRSLPVPTSTDSEASAPKRARVGDGPANMEYEPIDFTQPYEITPDNTTTPKVRTSTLQNDYLLQFLARRSQLLESLYLSEHKTANAFCTKCRKNNGLYRCSDCFGQNLLCVECTQEVHTNLPFHRIQQWCGSHFTRAALWQVGVKLFLGHGGMPCPSLLVQHCAVEDGAAAGEETHCEAAAVLADDRTSAVHTSDIAAVDMCDHQRAPPRTGSSIPQSGVSMQGAVQGGVNDSPNSRRLDTDGRDPTSDIDGSEIGLTAEERIALIREELYDPEEEFDEDIDIGVNGSPAGMEEDFIAVEQPMFCPLPPLKDAAGDRFIRIVSTTGIHELAVAPCFCAGAADEYLQFMEIQLFPASYKRVSTAFTFAAMDDFRLQNLECKRAEVFDDHKGDSNWKKMIGITATISKKYKRAEIQDEDARVAFQDITDAAPEDIVEVWDAEIVKAEIDRMQNVKAMNILRNRLTKEISKKELIVMLTDAETEMHGDLGHTAWIAAGLDLEEEQIVIGRLVKHLGPSPTLTEKLDLAKMRQKLRVKIGKFADLARTIIGAAAVDLLAAKRAAVNDVKWTSDEDDWVDGEVRFEIRRSARDPECDELPLPIAFLSLPAGVQSRIRNLHNLTTKEYELRGGQANDALQRIREDLSHLAWHYKTRVRQAKSTKQVTRSWDGVHLLNKHWRSYRLIYGRARDKMISCMSDAEYYFMQAAHAFHGPGSLKIRLFSAICGSINEHVHPSVDAEILADTPSIKFWFNSVGDGVVPRLTLDDIEFHVDKYITVTSERLGAPSDTFEHFKWCKVIERINASVKDLQRSGRGANSDPTNSSAAVTTSGSNLSSSAAGKYTADVTPTPGGGLDTPIAATVADNILIGPSASTAIPNTVVNGAANPTIIAGGSQAAATPTVPGIVPPTPPAVNRNDYHTQGPRSVRSVLYDIRDVAYGAHCSIDAAHHTASENRRQTSYRMAQLAVLQNIYLADDQPWESPGVLTKKARKGLEEEHHYTFYNGFIDTGRGLPGAMGGISTIPSDYRSMFHLTQIPPLKPPVSPGMPLPGIGVSSTYQQSLSTSPNEAPAAMRPSTQRVTTASNFDDSTVAAVPRDYDYHSDAASNIDADGEDDLEDLIDVPFVDNTVTSSEGSMGNTSEDEDE
ncbi:hypothetical protein D9619_011889 [Psilocybe cf. subviscida]|uniref:CxC2-like cysteine cluster KDZ transposase-associated domain-containing protein n=1 Tax=Psilocybe cf. subviscida TaxID=2480587 RepID=A0A8H5EVU4_9AGAR|nr:hypothetical protein D9619_011889 [Psilocybe cf. subviscida]